MDERPDESLEPQALAGHPSSPSGSDHPLPDDEETQAHIPGSGSASSSPSKPDSADRPLRSEPEYTDFLPVSDVDLFSGPTPLASGSSPTEGFDPSELAETKLVEGAVLLKKYRLKEKLGSGGMGEVWRVHHIELDCDRALKFIRSGLSPSPELRKRFRREARVMARVDHPNAVMIHDAFANAGLGFIEMAYVPGQSLAEIFKAGRPMPLDWVVRILQQLCEVLAVAHEAGIVHRDLKPANLMLLSGRPPGREFLKVLDFGIAKLLSIEENDGPSITNNSPIGTYPYMSPEQLGVSKATVDTRSDIYSVGVILFEFLTGYRPYSAKNILYPWIQIHLHEPIPTFRDRNPGIELPPAVEAVVRRCLAKSPEDRPHSAQALFEEFDEASGLIRPPSRSGSSSYSFQSAAPTTRNPSGGSFLPVEHASASLVVAQPESASVPEVAELSTLDGSGSYEWIIPDAPSPLVAAPAASDDTRSQVRPVLHPPGGSRGLGRLVKMVVWVVLVSSMIACATFVVLSNKPPIPREPIKAQKFNLVPGVYSWQGLEYDSYKHAITNLVIYLPPGYRPVGTERAEDGWPGLIERTEDGVRFVRIAGTTTPYKAGKRVWKPGDPEDGDGLWLFEKNHPLVDKERDVDLSGFYMQRTEVTNRELTRYYQKYEQDEKVRDRLYGWYIDYLEKRDEQSDILADLPAVFVDIETATAYARSVGGVLPSRAEWEYAASSRGVRTDYVWGPLNGKEIADVCIGLKRRPVGISKKDVTAQGLFDMGGNVREWSSDLREGKPVACGGCFDDSIPFKLDACGIKAAQDISSIGNNVGFRVLLRCPPADGPTAP